MRAFSAGEKDRRRLRAELTRRNAKADSPAAWAKRRVGEVREAVPAHALRVGDEALLLRRGDRWRRAAGAWVQAGACLLGGLKRRRLIQQQAEVRVLSVLTVDVVEGRIQAVRIVRNPDKLRHL